MTVRCLHCKKGAVVATLTETVVRRGVVDRIAEDWASWADWDEGDKVIDSSFEGFKCDVCKRESLTLEEVGEEVEENVD